MRASLAADGLVTGRISANGLTLPVTASAGTVESAFSTSLRRFALPDGHTGFANTARPSIDPGVAGLVQAIVGLDTLAPTAPHIVVAHARHATVHAGSAAIAGRGCSAARAEASSQAS